MSDLSHKEERYKEYDHAAKMRRGYHFTIDTNAVWYCHDPSMSLGVFRNERLAALFSGAGKGFMAGKGLSVDEAGDYWLKSPGVAFRVEVEDVPFIVEKAEIRDGAQGQEIDFVTNYGERVALGAGCTLHYRAVPHGQGQALYVEVRSGLQARLSRNVNEEILSAYIEEKEQDGQVQYFIKSRGVEFPVMQMESGV